MSYLKFKLRVTADTNKGDRPTNEDFFRTGFVYNQDNHIELFLCGVFDGHRGVEAASYASKNLLQSILRNNDTLSLDDNVVLKTLEKSFIKIHEEMQSLRHHWPRTSNGEYNTSSTTATIGIIANGKLYVAHVGDSSIILVSKEPGKQKWIGEQVTIAHKPDNPIELQRITAAGGKVAVREGIARVVWTRPSIESSEMVDVPFMLKSRALGDCWSLNTDNNEFIVSPKPDLSVIDLDYNTHKCIIFTTDGVTKALSLNDIVTVVQSADEYNERQFSKRLPGKSSAQCLVEISLLMGKEKSITPDNATAVVIFIDPPKSPSSNNLRGWENQNYYLALSDSNVDNSNGTIKRRGSVAVYTQPRLVHWL